MSVTFSFSQAFPYDDDIMEYCHRNDYRFVLTSVSMRNPFNQCTSMNSENRNRNHVKLHSSLHLVCFVCCLRLYLQKSFFLFFNRSKNLSQDSRCIECLSVMIRELSSSVWVFYIFLRHGRSYRSNVRPRKGRLQVFAKSEHHMK